MFCSTESKGAIGNAKLYVINSAAEYRAAFDCGDVPALDFGAYTLLVGKSVTANCSSLKSQHVKQACANYQYSVKLREGLCTAVTQVTYHALIPKIAAGARVSLDVELVP